MAHHHQQQQAPRSGGYSGGGMYGLNPQYAAQSQDQQWYGGPASAPGGGYGGSAPSSFGGDESGNVHIGSQGFYSQPAAGGAPGPTSWGSGAVGSSGMMGGEEDYSNEPPLMEELGINFRHIWTKTKTIILPIKVCQYADAAAAAAAIVCLSVGVAIAHRLI